MDPCWDEGGTDSRPTARALTALESWLSNAPRSNVKFVVLPVPVFPEPTRSNGGGGFCGIKPPPGPEAGGAMLDDDVRTRILNFVAARRLARVVFVAGGGKGHYWARLEDANGLLPPVTQLVGGRTQRFVSRIWIPYLVYIRVFKSRMCPRPLGDVSRRGVWTVGARNTRLLVGSGFLSLQY